MSAPRGGGSRIVATLALTLATALFSSCRSGGAGTGVPAGGTGGASAATGGMTGTGGTGNGAGGANSGTGGNTGATGGAGGTSARRSTGGADAMGTGGGAASGGNGGGSGADSGGSGANSGGGGGNGSAGGIGGGGGSGALVAAGVRWFGRVDTTDPMRPRFGWSGTGFIARLTGNALNVSLNNTGAFVFKSVVDGVPQPTFTVTVGQGMYALAMGLPAGPHTVELYRQTEGVYGDSQFLGLTVSGGTLADPPATPGRLIEVVGASVSCGYGDLGVLPCTFSFATESNFDAYESFAGRSLNADVSVVAISGRGMYRNTDGTTDGTMPKLYTQILAGAATPVWSFRTAPDVVVINLGKNDFTLGDPGPAFPAAYLAFTRMLRTRYPGAFIVCTTGPNLGDVAHAGQLAYVNQVIATRHAEGDSNIVLLDWTEEVAGEIGCDVHPNAIKQKTMGDALAALLRARLGW